MVLPYYKVNHLCVQEEAAAIHLGATTKFPIKEQITDNSRLFQDAVSFVFFWMRSLPVLC